MQSWESGKFQLARWSHRLLFLCGTCRPGKNSSPTGILVFPSNPYCKMREFFNWKGTLHYKKQALKAVCVCWNSLEAKFLVQKWPKLNKVSPKMAKIIHNWSQWWQVWETWSKSYCQPKILLAARLLGFTTFSGSDQWTEWPKDSRDWLWIIGPAIT